MKRRTPAPPPKLGRRAQLVRADIVGSAARSFAAKGYAATTMDDVAKQAGFTASSLYGYFSGKDELYAATLETITQQLLAVFDDPLRDQLPYLERIQWLLRRLCQEVEPNRELFVLLFGQAPFLDWTATSSAEVAAVGKKAYARLLRRVADEIGAADPRARSKADALDIAYVVGGAFQNWVFRWIHGDMPDGLQHSLTRLFAMLKPVLEAPPAPPATRRS